MLINYWRELVIVLLLASLGYLKYELKSSEIDLVSSNSLTTQYKMALDYQNNQLLVQEQEYKQDLVDANESNVITRTKFKNIYTIIYSYQGDKNETDCNNTIKFYRGITY